jgi:DNA modification methylase
VSSVKVICGDALESLRTLENQSVNTCVTSPPFWGLRDYGKDGQLGLENTPQHYVDNLVEVFRELRRVLCDDGTLWINLGDIYKRDKQLTGMPWRVAFGLQADGWVLRQDIIWHKPNPMPESAKDRCTKAHEYIFLLSKSSSYYYDFDSIKEEADFAGAKITMGPKSMSKRQATGRNIKPSGNAFNDVYDVPQYRNKRSVWTVTTKPYKGAHFATYPPDLIRPCILAGCPEGGTVLDPFAGSGTTGQVAANNQRDALLIELNSEYVSIIEKRLGSDMFIDLDVEHLSPVGC